MATPAHPDAIALQQLFAPPRATSPRSIDNLPTEILRLVFNALWRATTPHPRLDIETWPWYHPVHSSLITITHVSRRWRDIALDIPLLWSRIDNRIRSRTLAFLRRSRASPISLSAALSVSRGGTSAYAVHDLFDSCNERLIRLDVRLEAADIFTRPRLDFLAPNLKVFTLQCEIYAGVQVQQNPVLFRGKTTALQAMALLHVRHWLPGNTFPNLLHLNISYFFMEELPLTVLTRLLADCPRLESLHLGQVWSYARFDLDLTPPSAPIRLPNLHNLSTSCATLQTISALLSSLVLPKSVRIRIHDAPVQLHTTARENILPSLDFMGPITHLKVAADGRKLYLLAECEDSPAALWLQGIWNGNEPGVWADWLTFLHEMFGLPAVRTFHLAVKEWSLLPHLLPQMQSLTTLGLMTLPYAHARADTPESQHEQMLAALCSTLGSGIPPYCPNLSTLSLQCDAVPSVTPIARMLAYRAKHEARLSHLAIDRMRIPRTRPQDTNFSEGAFRYSVPDQSLVRAHVDSLTLGEGGVCTWEHSGGWDVEIEHWRLPVGDEPRCVLPWHSVEDA